MRRIWAACFSGAGERLAGKLPGVEITRFPGSCSLRSWTEAGFNEADALIFVGACQIAVRAIAPFVKSKLTDPAVLVIDETGNSIIPILGGHIAGANKLASLLAERTGARAVITTATDSRSTFAADSWAVENGYGIVNPEAVKEISASVLDGDELELRIVRQHSDGDSRASGRDPSAEDQQGYSKNRDKDQSAEDQQKGSKNRGREPSAEDLRKYCKNRGREPENQKDGHVLRLVPRTVIVGAGCRRGTDPEHMEDCFLDFCASNGIEPASVGCIASINLKKDEAALRLLAYRRKIPFLTFSAEKLMETEGEFISSEFVRETTGADNVCERAAVCALKELAPEAGVALSVRKTVYDGITFAAVRRRSPISWRWLDDKD